MAFQYRAFTMFPLALGTKQMRTSTHSASLTRVTLFFIFLLLSLVLMAGCDEGESSPSSDGDRDDVTDGDQDTPESDGDGDSDDDGDTPPSMTGWEFPRLHVEGLDIVDASGRTVLLRGINIGGRAKIPPHIPWQGDPEAPDFLDEHERYMDFPADWAMNCIRLTVFWEAVEPERGTYDEHYLDFIESQIEAAAQRGMYVFLDFHQDLFSRYLGGSGAPAWALENPPAEAPPLDDTSWFMKVFSDETVLGTFDRFWSNGDGIQDAYIAMVEAVAARFADAPNLLGIDLMNEPNPGADGKEDLALWHTTKLIPFYTTLSARIREQAPHFIMFLEPSGLEAGQSESEESWTIEGIANYILSPHYYYPMQFVLGEYNGDAEEIADALAERSARATELGVPALLSEFGFRGSQDDPGDDGNAGWFFDDLYASLDTELMHATVWTHEVSTDYWNQEDCSFVNSDWTERVPRADAVARPYPEFTNGEAIAFSYSPVDKHLSYSYRVDAEQTQPTVIRLPKRHYPQAPSVTLAFGRYEYIEDLGVLLVFDSAADAPSDSLTEQRVEISPSAMD